MIIDATTLGQFAFLTLLAIIGWLARNAWSRLEERMVKVEVTVNDIDRKVTRLEVEMDRNGQH